MVFRYDTIKDKMEFEDTITVDYKIIPVENYYRFKKKFTTYLVTMQDNAWLRENTGKLSAEEIRYFYDKGILLFCTGKYEEAIEYFDKIIATNPASKIAFGYKGLALTKLKRHLEAVRCYEKALIC